MKYTKPPLTLDQQLDFLTKRGLHIENRAVALNYLKNINYYRLSAYFIPFKKLDRFNKSTTFKKISNLYYFDCKLRALILEAIEPIEIALRARIIYCLSHHYGVFGYLNPENFSPRFQHIHWIRKLEKLINSSNETFIQHYKKKYASNKHLPPWIAFEIISFGGLSKLFKGLHGKDQQDVAKEYELTDVVLSSWLHVLVYIRNLCAHHSRLWNRTLTFKPKMPHKNIILCEDTPNDKIFMVLLIIQYFLDKQKSQIKWKEKLFNLLDENNDIPLRSMGFPKNWGNLLIWDSVKNNTLTNQKMDLLENAL